MSEHTEGLLRYSYASECFGVVWAGKTALADTSGNHLSAIEQRANARRIVACWNACASYSTENLEEFGRWISSGEVPAVLEIEQKLDAVEQQRDELQDVIRAFLEAGVGNSTDFLKQAVAYNRAKATPNA